MLSISKLIVFSFNLTLSLSVSPFARYQTIFNTFHFYSCAETVKFSILFGYAFLSINSNLFLLLFNHKKKHNGFSQFITEKKSSEYEFLVSLCLINAALSKTLQSTSSHKQCLRMIFKSQKVSENRL